MKNYVLISSKTLNFVYNAKAQRYIADIQIENLLQSGYVITKLYITSYQNYSANPSIIATKAKDKNTMQIMTKKGMTPNDINTKDKFVTISVPIDKDISMLSHEEIKNEFKNINYKEIGQKIAYQVKFTKDDDIKSNNDISTSETAKTTKNEVNELNRQIEEMRKSIEEKTNEIKRIKEKRAKEINESIDDSKNSNILNDKENKVKLSDMKFSFLFVAIAMFISMFFGALLNNLKR